MDFGNCWKQGTVSVYLNDVEIANASAATEVTVGFEFHEGFVLKFVELGQSIIQFNGFSVIECIGKVVVQLSQNFLYSTINKKLEKFQIILPLQQLPQQQPRPQQL